MGKISNFLRRKKRTRAKIFGLGKRPRLSVYKSNRYFSAQLIDDEKAVTLASVSYKDIEKGKKVTKTEAVKLLGEEIAKKAGKLKIKSIVFDRGGYRYHGRIKAFADSVRSGGLEF